jgi:ferritin-like metal-binding protein YciE
MQINSFKEMYVSELQEARSLEAQLTSALPDMIKKTGDADLKQVLQEHLSETQDQMERVGHILQRHGATVKDHKDQSMVRLVSEAEKWAEMIKDSDQRDAGIIASAQRVEHYEMAVYGTLSAWAKQLGFGEDEKDLRAILAQERAADEKLTRLAEREINPSAA